MNIKGMLKKVSTFVLVLFMFLTTFTSNISNYVYAESEQQTEETNNETDNNGNVEEGVEPISLDEETSTKEVSTQPLSTIIDQDDDGDYLMYTALFNAQGQVIDSNDSAFTPESTNALNKDDEVEVHFWMASVTPNGAYGEGTGVQEGVTYTLDLPKELTPVKEKNGVKYVDGEYITFFKDGNVEAKGGIYTKEGTNDSYELRIEFSNVQDQLDISGEFQFACTVSNTVTEGSTVTLDYNPGGSVQFKVSGSQQTNDKKYEITLSGSQVNAEDYTVKAVATTGNTEDTIFNYRNIEINLDDNLGFLVDSTTKTYTLKIGDKTYTAKGSGSSIKFNGIDANITLKQNDVHNELVSNDSTVYITQKATLLLPSNIKATQVEVEIPAISYDDYSITTASYTGTAKLTGSSSLEDITSNQGTITGNYGSLSTPTLEETKAYNDPNNSYGYVDTELVTIINSSSTSYTGNHYYVQYEPSIDSDSNSANIIYYFNNSSFLEGNLLTFNSNINPYSSTNSTFYSNGTLIQGTSSIQGFNTGVSISSTNTISEILSILDTNDVKFAYQVKKVFESSSTNELVVYKSTTKYEDKNVFIVVDPDTNQKAISNASKGWKEYIDDNTSSKGATWKLHVFNAPSSSFNIQAFQQQGALISNNNNGTGRTLTDSYNDSSFQFTDKVSTGIEIYNSSTTSSTTKECTVYGSQHNRTTSMTGIWVDDDTIFWEMNIPTNWLPNIYNGYFYIRISNNLHWGSNDAVTIDNQNLYAYNLYIKNNHQTTDPWEPIANGFSYTNLNGSNKTIYSTSPESSLSNASNTYAYYTQFHTSKSLNYYSNDDNYGMVTLGFTTLVDSDAMNNVSVDNASLSGYFASAELVAQTGDISRYTTSNGSLPYIQDSTGAQSQYSLRLAATSSTSYPSISKTGEVVKKQQTNEAGSKTDVDETSGTTKINWKLSVEMPTSASGSSNTDSYGNTYISSPYFPNLTFVGGYNGRIFIGDSMSSSTVTNSAGETITKTKDNSSFNLGSYNHITQMFPDGLWDNEKTNGGGAGPIPTSSSSGDTSWQKLVNGEWVSTSNNFWSSTEAGIYKRVLSTSNSNNANNPMEITVYYSGDMNKSIREAYSSGLPKGVDLDLSNDIAQESIVIEFDGLTHLQTIEFGNDDIAYVTEMSDSDVYNAVKKDTTSTTDTTTPSTSSGVIANITNNATVGQWATIGKEASSATISKFVSQTLSIAKETPARKETVGKDLNDIEYTIYVQVKDDKAQKLEISDYITQYSELNANNSTSEAKNSLKALNAILKSLTINDLKIEQTDAYGNAITNGTVYKDGAFKDGWNPDDATLTKYDSTCSDTRNTTEGNGSLFNVVIKRKDGTDIYQDSVFKITYKLHLDMDTNVSTDSNTITFRNSDYYSGDQLKINNGAIATRTSNDSTTLSVKCDGDVTGTYLAHPVVIKKTLAVQTTDTTNTPDVGYSNRTSWLVYDWTGTIGKDKITSTITDSVGFDLYNVSDTTVKNNILELMAKYLSIKNVKVYRLQNSTSAPTSSNLGTSVWDNITNPIFDYSENGSDSNMSQTKSGSDGDPTYTINFQKASTNTDENNDKTLIAPGFTLTATNLGQQEYLVATYDIDFDKAGFFSAAKQQGLLNDDGKVIIDQKPTNNPRYKVNNTASDGWGEASSTSSTVSLKAGTISKSASSTNSKEGTASYTISVNSGNAGNATNFKVSDTMTFSGTQASAALQVTSINIDSVTVAGTQLESAKYTVSEPTKNTNAKTLSFDVTLSDPVVENTKVVIKYTATLDKSSFITNFDQQHKSDASYTISNSSSFEANGSTGTSSTVTSNFKPSLEIGASKSIERYSSDGLGITFKMVGETKSAARNNFTMEDTLSGDEDALNALMITDIKATVVTGTGDSALTTTYTSDDLLSGKDGYQLSQQDGSTFLLNTTGIHDWKLVVSSIEANTTVTVEYTVSLDRNTYITSEGALGPIEISNDLSVSTAGGAEAKADTSGKITVTPDIQKVGKEGTLTGDGKRPITWTFDVNLNNLYSSEELANLKNVTISDKLDTILSVSKPYSDQVEVYDITYSNGTVVKSTSALTNDTDYKVDVDSTNTFKLQLISPKDHPMIRIELTTISSGTLNSLTNTVDLSIDGETVSGDTTTVDGIIAVAEYGRVTSSTVPMWTCSALKTVDGSKPNEKTFSFILEEVGGNKITAKNDSEGNINFPTIKYNKRPIIGTHTYKLYEDSTSVDSSKYDMDTTIYEITVEVSKDEERGVYTAVETIKGNKELIFNNTTKPESKKEDKKQDSKTVNTSDTSNPLFYGSMMISGLLLASLFITLRRKHS